MKKSQPLKDIVDYKQKWVSSKIIPFYHGKNKIWKGDNEMHLQEARQVRLFSLYLYQRYSSLNMLLSMHSKVIICFWKVCGSDHKKLQHKYRLYYEI